MKEKRNVHLKVQELCDCYATTDPLQEMSRLKDETQSEDAALKWLALAALHGVNGNAKKISIEVAEDGKVSVTAKYRKSELPAPDATIGKKVISAVREITHIDGKKGRLPIALGIRDSQLTLDVKVESEKGTEKITINFPE